MKMKTTMYEGNSGSVRYYGCHVSASGGLARALDRADELGINTIQVHPSPPQKWNSKPFPPGIEAPFLERRRRSCVEKVFFHGIYLINLANPDPAKQELSKLSLLHDLELNARIGGDGVIFHVGSMKDEPDAEVGIARAAACIDWVMERAPRDSLLLLEVAAGSGSVIGSRFEELASIYDRAADKDRLGFALDTQHLWASGYRLGEETGQLLDAIETSVGLRKVKAVHFNDSKSACGSRVDRHENLGAGLIGKETLRRIFLEPRLADIPFILETPAMRETESTRAELAVLREFLGE